MFATERPDAEVLSCALARSAGLLEAESRFSRQTMEAADRFSGIGWNELLLHVAREQGVWASGRASLTSDNVHEVMCAAVSTQTLSDILTRAGDSLLLAGFQRSQQKWRACAAISPVSNLRPTSAFRLTGDAELKETPASGHVEHAAPSEEAATVTAKSYARLFTVTRQDLFDDNLGVLQRLRTELGYGAGLALRKEFWGKWLAAVAGAAFWTSSRGNLQSGASTALSEASLSSAIKLLRAQRDLAGNLMDLPPAYVLVPPELESTATALCRQHKLDAGRGRSFEPDLLPVTVPELSDTTATGYSATHWFLCSDPGVAASACVTFLNGREQPTIDNAQPDFKTLGIALRAHFDFGVEVSEHRASVLSDGTD